MDAKNFAGKMRKGDEIFGNLKNLGILALVVVGIIVVLSMNVSANTCTCNDCSSCTNALKDSNCNIVKLTDNITNVSGSCIDPTEDCIRVFGFCVTDPYPLQNSIQNKIFDCQRYIIDGDDSGSMPKSMNEDALDNLTRGITIKGSNNQIKNCKISDFLIGVVEVDNKNGNFLNNSVYSNSIGMISITPNNHYFENNKFSNNNMSGLVMTESITITYGISMTFGTPGNNKNNFIINNTFFNNTASILMNLSLNNKLMNNSINSSSAGIVLLGSSKNTIENNNFTSNSAGAALMKGSNNNVLQKNHFYNTSLGIGLIRCVPNFTNDTNTNSDNNEMMSQFTGCADVTGNAITNNTFLNDTIAILYYPTT